MNKIKWLFLSLFLCFFTAFLGSGVTMPSIDSWYQTIQKPVFNPPNWIFGPVWTLLFFLMAISFYLILIQKPVSKKGIILFVSQLFFNFLWSYSFFFLHNPLLAYIDILILIVLVVLTTKHFMKLNRTAGLLLIPYIAWISFASILNLAIVLLN
jgi:tryptophan-rich sensory protein